MVNITGKVIQLVILGNLKIINNVKVKRQNLALENIVLFRSEIYDSIIV